MESHHFLFSANRTYSWYLLTVAFFPFISATGVYGQEATDRSINSAERLIQRYDLNGDKEVSKNELTGLPDKESETSEGTNDAVAPDNPQSAFLVPDHKSLFQLFDEDCNGLLNDRELKTFPNLYWEFAQLAAAEQRLRKVQLPQFEQLDVDQNRTLTRSEWEVGIDQPESQWKAEFRLCDFNKDNSLSFLESVSTSRYGSAFHEPGVPDPVQNEMQRMFHTIIMNLASANNDDGFSYCKGTAFSHDRVLSVVRVSMPFLNDVSTWDRNQDNQLTRQEIMLGLQVVFGVRNPQGMLLRRNNGEVFNLKTIGYFDVDKNGQLSREEFLAKYWQKPIAAELFAEVDLNGDDIMQTDEANKSEREHFFWVDSFDDFRRLDANGDSRISTKELASEAKSFESGLASQVFPGFDENRDGFLSFLEFRTTPFNFPTIDLNWKRWDKDHDAQLSLDEYYAKSSLPAVGAMQFLFSHLDQNSDNQLALFEHSFNIKWEEVSTDRIFSALDADQNNSLTLDEAIRPFAGEDEQSEIQVAKIEFGFAGADENQDARVSKAEFLEPGSMIVATITGQSVSRRKAVDSAANIEEKAGMAAWEWRKIILVTLNVVAVISIGILILRKRRPAVP